MNTFNVPTKSSANSVSGESYRGLKLRKNQTRKSDQNLVNFSPLIIICHLCCWRLPKLSSTKLTGFWSGRSWGLYLPLEAPKLSTNRLTGFWSGRTVFSNPPCYQALFFLCHHSIVKYCIISNRSKIIDGIWASNGSEKRLIFRNFRTP